MDKRNKAWRRRMLMLHWKRRLKEYSAYSDFRVTNNDGEVISHPFWWQIAASKWGKKFKTTGTPCSCSWCKGERYDRQSFKYDTAQLIRDSEA